MIGSIDEAMVNNNHRIILKTLLDINNRMTKRGRESMSCLMPNNKNLTLGTDSANMRNITLNHAFGVTTGYTQD